MSLNRPLAPALAAVFALSAGACAGVSGLAPKASSDSLTPMTQYKPVVEQIPDQLALAPHLEGLSPAQTAALSDFAARWRAAGEGDVAIRAPTGGDAAAVSRSTYAAQAALEALGVPRGSIEVVSYVADGDPRPPVLIHFDRYTTKAIDCSKGWDNLVATGQNRPSSHFGCAVTANFSAQIANPRDLVQQTPSDPSDASRRANVVTLYRKGEVTSSKQDEQANGAVSKAVK